MDLVNIRDLFRSKDEYLDTTVTIGGWVRSLSNSKNFGFIVVNDGTFFEPVQVVFSNVLELSLIHILRRSLLNSDIPCMSSRNPQRRGTSSGLRRRMCGFMTSSIMRRATSSWRTCSTICGSRCTCLLYTSWSFLAKGDFTVDEATRAQAQADIADDGYWGVDQTSDRILDFAKALSGNDPEKADLLLDAFKKGFKEATKSWGQDLPDISQRTYDAVVEKFNKWKNGTEETETAQTQA